MKSLLRTYRCSTSVIVTLTCLFLLGSAVARGQSIDVPAPRASTNAAVHYQRAALFLGAVDPELRELTAQPIWKIVTHESTAEDLAKVDRLLTASRHAIRSALVGASQTEADFGLDIDQYMIASFQPHTNPMTELARLVALHGLKQQSNGDWQGAVETYFYCLRMGRHLTHQTTLAEALSGVSVLETGYFVLSNWATRCPDKALVKEALNIIDAMAGDMVNPARTMRFEASIAKMRLQAISDAFPNGAWAEMVLESLGADFPSGDADDLRAAAKQAALAHGVPKEAFANKENFTRYVASLRKVYVELDREAANCYLLAAPASIEQAAAVFTKYSSKMLPTERKAARNPAVNAAYFAVQQAELDVLRLVLAVSAAKTADGFPANLDVAQGHFGGKLPTSPYDGSAYGYEQLEDGKGFAVTLSEATVAGQELPPIRFQFLGEPAAE